MKAQAIVLANGSVDYVPEGADLIAWMEVRGRRHIGFASRRTLRDELRGQPIFAGLIGPMWGGPDCSLRYEDSAAYDEYSR